MTSLHHRFTAAPSEDGIMLRCCCCDMPRTTRRATCPSCREVTDSYECPDDGSISGTALTMFEAETLDMLWNGSLGLAPTCQVGMRGVVA